jgi:TRAP-type mannitol/chloroaromatic compound transport system substrate-binding protein
MNRTEWLRIAAIAGVAGWVVAGTGADAQERVRWKLASSYGSQIDVLGKNILRVIDNIKVMSDGHSRFGFTSQGRWSRRSKYSMRSRKARSRHRTPRPASPRARSRT